jgi:type II restriction enzyme
LANVKEAQSILKDLGLPPAQYNEMSALTLIALCGLGKNDLWSSAKRAKRTISKDIMHHVKIEFGKEYAPNTRETFRRQVLHQFVQAQIADYNSFEPNLPTNSPRAHYAITDPALSVVQRYGTTRWKNAVKKFYGGKGALAETYASKRELQMVAIQTAEGKTLQLSPGKHNEVQKAIVEEFAPRFAGGANLIYLGDTALKNLMADEIALQKFGFDIENHSKLPDVIFYQSKKKWLYLIEAVTSHGPFSPKRVVELEKMLKKSEVGIVYVSAFPDMAEFKKHAKNIAWETEVWLADMPDHLIHFNGDRFFGPRPRK